mmetsp:Transcript_51884/g.70756  ORF Transcript_51884/g.70756 Transcript_51884/m.70756 type:complete len:85 (-) Transcript_51884:580-834(-)
MVLSLWAMTSTVRWWPSAFRAFWIDRSVRMSKAEVASSSSTIGGSFSRHRAMATRCFSPPLSLSPRSPTIVFHPSLRPLIKPRI